LTFLPSRGEKHDVPSFTLPQLWSETGILAGGTYTDGSGRSQAFVVNQA
jgi:hypothetical protein